MRIRLLRYKPCFFSQQKRIGTICPDFRVFLPRLTIKQHFIVKKYWIDIVLALAVAALFILHFQPSGKNAAPATSDDTAAASASLIDSQIAYIEIDSIIPNYHMYINLTAELQTKQNQKEADLNTKAQKFQADVADFQNKAQKGLETRAKLEEMGNALSEREQQLAALQQQYAMEISEEAQVINRKVLQSIMDYLAVYNESHHFHYILGTSFGGMILYSDKSLDITREILDGLNKTYDETAK